MAAAAVWLRVLPGGGGSEQPTSSPSPLLHHLSHTAQKFLPSGSLPLRRQQQWSGSMSSPAASDGNGYFVCGSFRALAYLFLEIICGFAQLTLYAYKQRKLKEPRWKLYQLMGPVDPMHNGDRTRTGPPTRPRCRPWRRCRPPFGLGLGLASALVPVSSTRPLWSALDNIADTSPLLDNLLPLRTSRSALEVGSLSNLSPESARLSTVPRFLDGDQLSPWGAQSEPAQGRFGKEADEVERVKSGDGRGDKWLWL